tara:strand:+ start:131 stop:379 length:249 start_codon:yes stop_codon:yes gene_type:complete
MPVYCYKCTDCEFQFETRHSMDFEDQKCTACNSVNIFKIPSLNIEQHRHMHSSRIGRVVDKYINDVKQEVKQEKKNLRSKEL